MSKAKPYAPSDPRLGGSDLGTSMVLPSDVIAALDPSLLVCVLTWRMPFGRYETWPMLDLPEPYVVWMHRNAKLEGRLGQVMDLLYEIKVNGLESMLKSLTREEIQSILRVD